MSSNIFPSINAWITPRAVNAKIDTNNCLIMLPQKIDKIDKVVVKADTVSVMAQSGTSGGTDYVLSDFYLQPADGPKVEELDITKYIVEEAKYNTLHVYNTGGASAIEQLAKDNTHYYKHGGTDIHIVANVSKGILFDKTNPWDMALQASFIDYASKTQLYYDRGQGDFVKVTPTSHAVFHLSNNPMFAQFRVYYTTLGESVKLQVPKTNPQVNQFCIPYSQQQPIVDNVTLGREMQSVANRAGCETKEVVRTCHSKK